MCMNVGVRVSVFADCVLMFGNTVREISAAFSLCFYKRPVKKSFYGFSRKIILFADLFRWNVFRGRLQIKDR